MPTDGAIAKFLYTILKQLDLKSVRLLFVIKSLETPTKMSSQIDWNEVAGSLDITNGHAARMRFSRFKQQMEGVQAPTRKPRASAPRSKKEKQKQDKVTKPDKPTDDEASPSVKPEPEDGAEPMHGVEQTVKTSPQIKPEPKEEIFEELPAPETNIDAEGFRRMSLEHKAELDMPTLGLVGEDPVQSEIAHVTKEEPLIKPEPVVKVEPRWDD